MRENGLAVEYDGKEFKTDHEGYYVTGPDGHELELDKEHPVRRFVSERFDTWQKAHSEVVDLVESMDKVRSIYSMERGFQIQLERSHYEIQAYTFYPDELEDIRVVFDHHDNMGNITEILLEEDLKDAVKGNTSDGSDSGE